MLNVAFGISKAVLYFSSDKSDSNERSMLLAKDE